MLPPEPRCVSPSLVETCPVRAKWRCRTLFPPPEQRPFSCRKRLRVEGRPAVPSNNRPPIGCLPTRSCLSPLHANCSSNAGWASKVARKICIIVHLRCAGVGTLLSSESFSHASSPRCRASVKPLPSPIPDARRLSGPHAAGPFFLAEAWNRSTEAELAGCAWGKRLPSDVIGARAPQGALGLLALPKPAARAKRYQLGLTAGA